MQIDELKIILKNHKHWLNKDCNGWENMKAELYNADLQYADLSYTNLRGANLNNANLRSADLRYANLIDVNLRGANLNDANLRGAILSDADLRYANLNNANLHGTNLCDAKIEKQYLDELFPLCCPEYGAFIGWKKAHGLIVKLLVTEDAKRSSAFGRKCRCSKATVLKIENVDGSDSEWSEIDSNYDNKFLYRVGETVEVENFDEDRTHECAPGIHFFITRKEAVNY